MKRSTSLVLSGLLLCAVVAAIVSAGPGETEAGKPLFRKASFMSQKRLYSQLALEGLMLQQKELVVEYGTKMWNTSEDAVWRQLFQDESKDQVYQQQAKQFRNNILAMVEAARQDNLDSAMTAYARSIQSCYDCHKYVRAPGRARSLESSASR